MSPDLSARVGSVLLKNPVMSASGTFGYGLEFTPFYDISRLGAVIVKGLSLLPTPGNAPGRIVETPAGMLNAIGLQNIGVERFVSEVAPRLDDAGAVYVANIYGRTIEEYEAVAAKLDRADGVHAIEVNISCPNVKKGGMAFGTDLDSTSEVLKAVRGATELPVIAKLSPNVTSVVPFAERAAHAGVDALSLINTLLGMAIDIRTRKPKLANITGGLSGPAIRPVAIRIVWQVHRAVGLPILGMGGIMNADDAIEFMLAGASAVAVGTANFVNPAAPVEIVEGIRKYLAERDIDHVYHIIGQVEA